MKDVVAYVVASHGYSERKACQVTRQHDRRSFELRRKLWYADVRFVPPPGGSALQCMVQACLRPAGAPAVQEPSNPSSLHSTQA